MSSNRREFVRRAAALAAAFAAHAPVAGSQRGGQMPTARASAFMTGFGLKYPIGNAGMGLHATPELAAAVSNAGGLGSIGTGTTPPPDLVRRQITRTKTLTDRPFAINFLLQWDTTLSVPAALDAGAPIIQFAWGLPTKETAAAVRKAGAKMGIQVSTADGAKQSIDLGADYLICQGTEAGGHVQGMRALYDALPAVMAEAKTVPVLAAGGIANGAHIKRALLAGASGVYIGTRFVATRESGSHDDYKAALTKAKAGDTAMSVCYQDGWPNATHRTLRNPTLEMWEAAGCPPPGRRPGEGDILTTHAVTGATKRRYVTSSPYRDDRGKVLELALHAGQGVDAIRDIPSAGDLVARLWKECLEP